MQHSILSPDYEKLRQILHTQLGRDITIEEAIGMGDWLLEVYETLLYNRGEYGKIEMDTTNH